jgi:diadenosine tetraphosphate (Ap4A) HIT family hydrolase
MPTFALHPQFAADTIDLGQLPLCRVLLMNDANYPWLILVPQRPNLREIFELDETDQQQLMRESSLVARSMSDLFKADKINIAALGNRVPQLHIHHIARYLTDPTWPASVFGAHPARVYPSTILTQRRAALQSRLGEANIPFQAASSR